MTHDYHLALQRLLGLSRFGVRLGLVDMAQVLARMGDPHRAFHSLHVAGTNGKGSVAAMLEACLRAAGVRTGLYISPHLCRFTERIRVAGQEIPPGRLAALVDDVLAREPGITFFETATAVAFRHFASEGVEVAVVETGLGGRLDATNVVDPEVSVITHIGLDHTEILGPDPGSIAREKAGIVKPGVPLVCAAGDPAVDAVLEAACLEAGSEHLREGRDFAVRRGPGGGASFVFRGEERLRGLEPALAGPHQDENTALCLAALQLLGSVPDEAVRRGLREVRWPGRLQWVGRTLLDGAHNPLGTEALGRALPPGEPFSIVLGALGPKDGDSLVRPLLPHAARVVFTRPHSPRALDPEDLRRLFPGSETAPDLATALAMTERDPHRRLVTGSLYLVGEALTLLAAEPADPLLTADPLGAPVAAATGGP